MAQENEIKRLRSQRDSKLGYIKYYTKQLATEECELDYIISTALRIGELAEEYNQAERRLCFLVD